MLKIVIKMNMAGKKRRNPTFLQTKICCGLVSKNGTFLVGFHHQKYQNTCHHNLEVTRKIILTSIYE